MASVPQKAPVRAPQKGAVPQAAPKLRTNPAASARKAVRAPKAASVQGTGRALQNGAGGAVGQVQDAGQSLSAYQIMANRIASRVAEMAENFSIVERVPAPQQQYAPPEKKKPRKLEMRLETSKDGVSFSAPFLDNTLTKMLKLQNEMLATGSELAKNSQVDEKVKKQQFAQTSELSKIIALICAEKARQEGSSTSAEQIMNGN